MPNMKKVATVNRSGKPVVETRKYAGKTEKVVRPSIPASKVHELDKNKKKQEQACKNALKKGKWDSL